jgi:CTP synthase
VLKKDTKTHQAYRKNKIYERHRHRSEFNNKYRAIFKRKGIIFSGICPKKDLVEIIELRDHPWFVACQFHPEFKSKPDKAHPLFGDFIKASLKNR